MRKIIDILLEYVLTTILVSMLLIITWQVFSRYFLKAPSTFTDEAASFLLIWLGLLGCAYATGKKQHLAVDVFPKKLILKNPRRYQFVVYGFILLFALLIMTMGGLRLCWITYQLNQESAVLRIPIYSIYSSIPLSGCIIVYYTIDSIVSLKKSAKSS
ncbi:TRAP transporter small permease [Aquimarina sp. U1-2]|uniref:TRAP transporter small permease n=1 Tax=Aquimarina sp. U1-2 TaxID=2823141 RepID=UPI001AECA0B8|nr:TRAP transporter small permease [Aquimarina sp. U1-2]MBP2832907.1 TRAP transporter small permease [Aquimarina sp. U1-2]